MQDFFFKGIGWALIICFFGGASFFPKPLPEVIQEAPLILQGKIEGGGNSDWVSHNEGEEATHNLYTFYSFQVQKVWKGTLPKGTSRISIRTLGGEKEGIQISVPGSVDFQAGENLVLFLQPILNEESYEVFGMMLGKYTLEKDPSGQEWLQGGALIEPPGKVNLAQFETWIQEAQKAQESLHEKLGLPEDPLNQKQTSHPSSFTPSSHPLASKEALSPPSSTESFQTPPWGGLLLKGFLFFLLGFGILRGWKKFNQKKKIPPASLLLFFFLASFDSQAHFQFPSWDFLKPVPLNKRGSFLSEGGFYGGDPQAHLSFLKAFQVQTLSPSQERFTLLFELSSPSPPSLSQTLGPYHISVHPARKEVLFQLQTRPFLSPSFQKFEKELKKSKLLQQAFLFPPLEEKVWHFTLQFKKPIQIEVSQPLKELCILVDIQTKTR